ncbi:glycoside hydrolase superfamily [Elsinoe ampelina]|uniref:cellulase n=1 Tax=Elsinoe ampelina TaxID=302913 RepID=A0A6A6G3A5_9PEZI|nr:glycoside hydrolase superfamily [Elsinoe ampelina]
MKFSSILVASTATLALAAPSKRQSKNKLQFWGVNESGAEFGQTNLPGTYNKDYTWYDLNAINTLIGRGMNTFRINLQIERVAPSKLDGPVDAAYMGNLTAQVKAITDKGAYAHIAPHNYGRYYGNIMTNPSAFKTFWANLARPFAKNSRVIFDTDNEFHDMDQDLVVRLNQAAIDGIRSVGATSQYITPEGNAWTGAWSWTNRPDSATGLTNGQTMGALKDPSNKLIYQMHQYLDSDASGTSTTCVNSTIFVDRLQDATKWLRANKKKGLIGEFAGGNNPTCLSALKGGLTFITQNTDVWTGALWWAAGPWWGNYIFNMEPTSGSDIYTQVLPQLEAIVRS